MIKLVNILKEVLLKENNINFNEIAKKLMQITYPLISKPSLGIGEKQRIKRLAQQVQTNDDLVELYEELLYTVIASDNALQNNNGIKIFKSSAEQLLNNLGLEDKYGFPFEV